MDTTDKAFWAQYGYGDPSSDKLRDASQEFEEKLRLFSVQYYDAIGGYLSLQSKGLMNFLPAISCDAVIDQIKNVISVVPTMTPDYFSQHIAQTDGIDSLAKAFGSFSLAPSIGYEEDLEKELSSVIAPLERFKKNDDLVRRAWNNVGSHITTAIDTFEHERPIHPTLGANAT